MFCHFHPSPLGKIRLLANEHGLTGLTLASQREDDDIDPDWLLTQEPFTECCYQLDAYFSGTLTRFTVPLAPEGTEFQKQVWRALRSIPYGETCSYKTIADAINNPKAVRAVGAANGKNPIAIIVPCHRVIGSNGKLTGYAGGVDMKAYLLKLEGSLVSDD
ncbi:methylated-DNA--[protein]-cysteine S-methyltransferase [Photobacterium swingsii]|uniref:Methylated-DNA--protein-cysteine methyltransferase n=1 Tax=Photobacterium swingsii TaxID=680026 RepID=A0A0J8VF99_9GAMM|nr:methylated-DNA--[protein]-cysteine S-methyltransferase [Photobacterium swingsii]KMV31956.1 cysteine methyltransferase [Photobacterium swingsii]PSW25612.1 cysteine methyltransferase [Photobacterium swingsii]